MNERYPHVQGTGFNELGWKRTPTPGEVVKDRLGIVMFLNQVTRENGIDGFRYVDFGLQLGNKGHVNTFWRERDAKEFLDKSGEFQQ